MLQPSIDGPTMTLPALREQYHEYVLTIRNICADTARERLRYIDGLFDYLGEPPTALELFAATKGQGGPCFRSVFSYFRLTSVQPLFG